MSNNILCAFYDFNFSFNKRFANVYYRTIRKKNRSGSQVLLRLTVPKEVYKFINKLN